MNLPKILLTALLAYNCATLDRIPPLPNDDDGGYASAAYQFWRTGRVGVPGYKNAIDLGRDVWAFGRLAAAFQGVFLHLAGVSVFAALLPSFLAGLALVALTGAVGCVLWDSQTGLWAALLLAASGKFFEACHWARPDILLSCFFLSSLWLVASAPSGNPGRNLFLAGLVMGLSSDVHLNGFLILPVPLLFWFLSQQQTRPVRWRGALAFLGAASLGLLFWLALHYWPAPDRFRYQLPLFGGQTHGLRIARLGLSGALKWEVKRYTDWFWAARGHRHLFEGWCVLSAGGWILWRGQRADRAVVGAWAAMFLLGAILMSNTFGWYLILVWPLFALWMARAFRRFPVRWLARLGLFSLFAAYLFNLALWHWKAQHDVPLRVRALELRRFLPADAPVLANGVFWFAFWDRDYTDAMYLPLRSLEARFYPSSGPADWESEQRKRGWRYIVASGDLRRFLDPEVPLEDLLSSEVYDNRRALVRETRAFSLARCSIERRFPGSDAILVLRIGD